jgi:uncharacterized protein YbaR (Trm112 family)/SAM-dependent methyltransferase
VIVKYANGEQETKLARLKRILPLLACPLCRGPLTDQQQYLICQHCGSMHPVRGGVPILLPAGVLDAGAVGLAKEDLVSRHPYSARAEEIIATHPHGWVLDLGAGGKLERRQNVVQIDIFRYPSVDAVGSADCLPFLDNSFDAIVSQAVFEHLQYPEWAVREVRRVLKPGGIAKIDTAFLQPEHGYPHHFYNATETGLQHWFRDFEIDWSGVEPFQHPKWAMHWFMGVYLDFIGEKEAAVLRQLSVGELVDTLQRHSQQQTTSNDQPVINALDAIPEQYLKVLAAGVSVQVINPPKYAIAPDSEKLLASPSLDREREMAQLRAERAAQKKSAAELIERLKLAQDKAEYLVQFSPQASNLVRLATLWTQPLEPDGAYLQAATTEVNTRPFATLLVQPTKLSSLLDTFFSLTNQNFSGWELVLLASKELPPGLVWAIEALCRLDRRVVVVVQEPSEVDLGVTSCSAVRGEYWMRLPEGATLAFNALVEIVTLAQNIPGVERIGFDFDRSMPDASHSMRCYTYPPVDASTSAMPSGIFEASFSRLESNGQLASQQQWAGCGMNAAHIPLILAHLNTSAHDEDAPMKASLAFLLEQNRQLSETLQQAVFKNQKLNLLGWLRLHVGRLLRKFLPSTLWSQLSKLMSWLDQRQARRTSEN